MKSERPQSIFFTVGRTFNLQHDAWSACLIPGEDFFVITGGIKEDDAHKPHNVQNYVDR